MELTKFEKFQKIPRFNRDCIVTEKIDGTNVQIHIIDRHYTDDSVASVDIEPLVTVPIGFGRINREIRVGSRNRWLTLENDNHGFAKWVVEHALFSEGPESNPATAASGLYALGPGRHYGEWWGQGIQRKYGLDHKRFSLFNVIRWNAQMFYIHKVLPENSTIELINYREPPECCYVAPILWYGPFAHVPVNAIMENFEKKGSIAAPGFMKPEGIVVYHVQGRVMFKKTFGNDGGKWRRDARASVSIA